MWGVVVSGRRCLAATGHSHVPLALFVAWLASAAESGETNIATLLRKPKQHVGWKDLGFADALGAENPVCDCK